MFDDDDDDFVYFGEETGDVNRSSRDDSRRGQISRLTDPVDTPFLAEDLDVAIITEPAGRTVFMAGIYGVVLFIIDRDATQCAQWTRPRPGAIIHTQSLHWDFY